MRLRFADLVLIALAGGFVLQIFWAFKVELLSVAAGLFLHGILPGCLALAVVTAIFLLDDGWRAALAVCGFTMVLALFGVEWLLRSSIPSNLAGDGSNNHLVEKIETRRAIIRAEGREAQPHYCPSFLVEEAPTNALLPLGGVSRNAMIQVTAEGVITIAESDRYGFNNPDTVWQNSGREPVLVVGDSFAYGADLPLGKGFVDLARDNRWALINLGCGGNGPLVELAGVLEYFGRTGAKHIVWSYYEGNDLTKDLGRERSDPRLSAYLESPDRAIQSLPERQKEIDHFLVDRLASRLETDARQRPAGNEGSSNTTATDWRGLLTLTQLRTRLGLSLQILDDDVSMFSAILARVSAKATQEGGKLIFLYLPAEQRFLNPLSQWFANGYRARIEELVRQQGGIFIDVAARFAEHPTPRALYKGHFNSAGASIVADQLKASLEALIHP